MNVRISSLIAIAALVGAACKSNPLADGAGAPTQVIANYQSLLVPKASSQTFTVSVVDSRLTPLATKVTFGNCNASVVTAVNDPTYAPVPATSQRAVVSGVALGQSCVTASASGLKPDTVAVSVLPLIFEGASFSSSTPLGGGPVTIQAGPLLKFTPSSVVTWPNGETATQLVNTPDSIVVLALFGGSGPATVTAVNTTYMPDPNVVFTLNTPSNVTTTGRFWAADTSVATAPVGLTLPAEGSSRTMITNVSGASNAAACADSAAVGVPLGPCMFYTFTLADTATLQLTMNWDGAPADSTHLVGYICPSPFSIATCQTAHGTTTFMGGRKSGAYPARPISTKLNTFAAGTYYFVIEQRAIGGNPAATIRPSNITVRMVH